MELRSLPASLCLAALLATTACTNNSRGTTPLDYKGDPAFAVESVERELVRRGFKPTCKKELFCRFVYEDKLDIHFKAGQGKWILIVDVVDGKKLPPAEEARLRAEGEKLGNEIFAAARVEAVAAEKNAQDVAAREDAEARRREAEEAKNRPPPSGPSLPNLIPGMSGNGPGATPTNGGGATSELSCCVNRQYFACPSAAAVNKCAGETAACLMGCQSSGGPGCEDRCIAEHGPDPSSCSRDPGRDSTCP